MYWTFISPILFIAFFVSISPLSLVFLQNDIMLNVLFKSKHSHTQKEKHTRIEFHSPREISEQVEKYILFLFLLYYMAKPETRQQEKKRRVEKSEKQYSIILACNVI